jgi:hypothetical protein
MRERKISDSSFQILNASYRHDRCRQDLGNVLGSRHDHHQKKDLSSIVSGAKKKSENGHPVTGLRNPLHVGCHSSASQPRLCNKLAAIAGVV